MLSNHFFPKRWSQKTIYIQFSRDRISVTFVEGQRTLVDVPIIACDQRGRVVALGAQAQQVATSSPELYSLTNPFGHPRTCIDDFDAAVPLVKSLVRNVYSRIWFKPVMIIHPHQPYKGGLTLLENRALIELLLFVGAQKACVWVGRPLTEEELRQRRFPVADGVLYPPNASL